jgi:hypothetical protein
MPCELASWSNRLSLTKSIGHFSPSIRNTDSSSQPTWEDRFGVLHPSECLGDPGLDPFLSDRVLLQVMRILQSIPLTLSLTAVGSDQTHLAFPDSLQLLRHVRQPFRSHCFIFFFFGCFQLFSPPALSSNCYCITENSQPYPELDLLHAYGLSHSYLHGFYSIVCDAYIMPQNVYCIFCFRECLIDWEVHAPWFMKCIGVVCQYEHQERLPDMVGHIFLICHVNFTRFYVTQVACIHKLLPHMFVPASL